MIDVSVSEDDTPNGSAITLRCFDNAEGGAREIGVDKREAIVFLDQETIDHPKAGEANQVDGFLEAIHGGLDEHISYVRLRCIVPPTIKVQ